MFYILCSMSFCTLCNLVLWNILTLFQSWRDFTFFIYLLIIFIFTYAAVCCCRRLVAKLYFSLPNLIKTAILYIPETYHVKLEVSYVCIQIFVKGKNQRPHRSRIRLLPYQICNTVVMLNILMFPDSSKLL